MTFRDLDPEAAQAELLANQELRVLDVRTPEESLSHRLPDATLIPVQELQQRVGELDRETPWLVICAHGRRSVFACEFLLQMGFEKVANLQGGLAHWRGRGLPVET